VIGVVDLRGGRAVHARAGNRGSYHPVQLADSTIEPGAALALARHYTERLGVAELYAADLDAILGGPPQQALAAAMARVAPLWLDAGISSVQRARQALDLGASLAVVGLETLSSYGTLEKICGAVGGNRVAFSLDVRNSEPVVSLEPGAPHAEAPHRIAARAARTGVSAIIVIDLARVGTSTGPDIDLIGRIREAAPGVILLAGGGVRGPDDLADLARAGCDGALVATALQDGRLSAAAVAAARGPARA
jgi:phosphoribosylformimino-5-aminoimidazole carboxamide ribotide isomerase